MDIEVFKRNGGSWLGAGRNWIKWCCLGGDSVRWDSDEALRTTHGPLTVNDVKEISAKVGFAVYESVLRKIEAKSQRLQAAVAETKHGRNPVGVERAVLAEKLQLIRDIINSIEADI